jgi:hypothetical protein
LPTAPLPLKMGSVVFTFPWSDETLDNVEQHGVTREEFELTVNDPDVGGDSRSSGLPRAKRWFGDRWVICIYKLLTPHDVEPVTAFTREDW